MNRRLPIYFLLDTSESMTGEPLTAMQAALYDVLRELRRDPNASEQVYVSFITFDSVARQDIKLTSVIDAEVPNLRARPGTSLGMAFLLLKECIDKEVIKSDNNSKGDYRPLVFLLTDGCPTDRSRIDRTSLLGMTSPRIANIYSIACGSDVDLAFLQSFSDMVFQASDISPEMIKRLFIWVSGSIQTSVMSLGSLADQMGINMDLKPDGVYIAEPGSIEEYTGPEMTIFLKSYCGKENKPYLIRYRYDLEQSAYIPVKIHKLEAEDGEADIHVDSPRIKASQIHGIMPCPYCGNESMMFCGCGEKICLPRPHGEEWYCIRCKRSGTWEKDRDTSNGEDYEVSTSAG